MDIKILRQETIKIQDKDISIICYIDPFELNANDIKELKEALVNKFSTENILVLPKDYIELSFQERKETISYLQSYIEQLRKENSENEQK